MGESATSSIFGTKGQESIKCSDPKFDEMICITQDDFANAVTCK